MTQKYLHEFEIPDPDINTVQEYCKHTKLLKKSQSSKALKFVEYDCIKYLADDPEFEKKYSFVCLPLNTKDHYILDGKKLDKKPYPVDYNWSDYKIAKNEAGIFECNCQGWQTKAKLGEWVEDGCMCSHVLALMYCFKLKKFGNSKKKAERVESMRCKLCENEMLNIPVSAEVMNKINVVSGEVNQFYCKNCDVTRITVANAQLKGVEGIRKYFTVDAGNQENVDRWHQLEEEQQKEDEENENQD